MNEPDTNSLYACQQELCASIDHKPFVAWRGMNRFESIDFVSEWTKNTREKLGLTQADLAGRATAAIEAAGGSRTLKQQTIDQLEKAQHKGVPDWFRFVRLVLDEATKDAQPKLTNPIVRREPDLPVTVQDEVEMVREVDIRLAMGAGKTIDDYPETGTIPFNRNFRRTLTQAPAEMLFVARGDGDSMIPTLLNDDMVLIDTTQREVRQSDRIWALRIEDAGMIKRVRIVPGGGYELLSDNPMVPPQAVARKHLHVIGRVIWIGRRV